MGASASAAAASLLDVIGAGMPVSGNAFRRRFLPAMWGTGWNWGMLLGFPWLLVLLWVPVVGVAACPAALGPF